MTEVVTKSRAAPKRKLQLPIKALPSPKNGTTAKESARSARLEKNRRDKEAKEAENDRRMREHHEMLRRQREQRASRDRNLFMSNVTNQRFN